MKSIAFKECNIKFAENQEEYETLPAYIDSGKQGIVVTCWKLSFWELLRALHTGRIWLSIWSFHSSLQPVLLTTRKRDVLMPVAEAEALLKKQKLIQQTAAEMSSPEPELEVLPGGKENPHA